MRGFTIKFTARFNKESNLTMGGQNLEYPEKENELRKNLFMALDKKLGGKAPIKMFLTKDKVVCIIIMISTRFKND